MLLDQLINGLTQGSTYALLALGFALIFGTLRLITFAHGEAYNINCPNNAILGVEISFKAPHH